ncbi:MAG: hypothetical protein EBW85_02045, partial [Burkholderiaceae bacterium]|nr:hypothetical protein [Burkholderiaceae bacterium]
MKIKSRSKIAAVLAAAGLVFSSTPAHAVDLQGSGATFVAPLLEACKAGFAKSTSHSYTYGGGGSGTGQKNSDADPAIVADNNRSVTEVIYKKDAFGNAKLDKNGKPEVLRTSKRNITMTLPNKPITVIYRSDSSGTSNNFTTFLNGVAKSIWTKAGNNVFATAFPGDINAKDNIGRIVSANGSAGVAALAAKTKYSITYAEKSFADSNNLKIAAVGNASGNFTLPTSPAVSAFLGEATVDTSKGFFTFDYATKEPGAYTLGIVSY